MSIKLTIEEALNKLDKRVLVLLCAKLLVMHNSWNAADLLTELLNQQNKR